METAYTNGNTGKACKPDDFYNVTSLAKLLKDYWLLGAKAPGQIANTAPRLEAQD